MFIDIVKKKSTPKRKTLISNNCNNPTENLQKPLYEYQWCEQTEELLIIWNTRYSQVITGISSWKKGIDVTTYEDNTAIIKSTAEEWHLPILADIELPPPELSLWLKKIPQSVLSACKPFNAVALNILEIASKNHAVAELLASNTVLFGLWYFYCRARNIGEPEFIKGCYRKRHHLLCYFEYPDTKAAVNVLRKIELHDINQKTLSVIENFFTHTITSIPITALIHRKTITLHYLKAISLSPWFYASTIFNKQYFSDSETLQLKRILEDMNEHGTIDLLNTASKCKSFNKLEHFYERHFLERAVPAHYPPLLLDNNGMPKAFPLPPILGNHIIEPISDYDTLWRLGKKMRNCISDMALKIVAGHYYVYQIYEPYCVTIGVNISNDNCFTIDQIRGHANSEVPESIQACINDWFRVARTNQNEHIFTTHEKTEPLDCDTF